MCDKGARNLIVPSRSGGSSSPQAVLSLVKELKDKGVNIITPQCDVSSADQLAELLEKCCDMPPIRGCINLAMELQVCDISKIFKRLFGCFLTTNFS